jgi:hypothetical protein
VGFGFSGVVGPAQKVVGKVIKTFSRWPTFRDVMAVVMWGGKGGVKEEVWWRFSQPRGVVRTRASKVKVVLEEVVRWTFWDEV